MTSDLEQYRQLALDLWFKDGSCTGEKPEPRELDDAINEDEEFRRIEQQQKNN